MRVIGLISGTSVDGIDAALVEISGLTQDLKVDLLAGNTFPYPATLREQILAVYAGKPLSMAALAELDDQIARCFAEAAIALQLEHSPAELIGSHGQTVFHRPPGKGGVIRRWGDDPQNQTKFSSPNPPPTPSFPLGYSLQLGRGALIAHLTSRTTISNFRAADIAAGGEGAPLVPAVDFALLSHPTLNRCVQNIGGIGNVTYLPARSQTSTTSPPGRHEGIAPSVIGWDTGPGNALLDLAVQKFSNGSRTYDQSGAWAASGTPCQELVQQWLQQEFFQLPPPKSTGRELFSPAYLEQCLLDAQPYSLNHADILATLTELTVASIAHSYHRFLPQLPDEVLLCGGGSKNLYLKQRLQAHLGETSVLTTDEVGLSADFKEAIAFAVLAYWRQKGIPGNLPDVTGARKAVLLGEIHQVS
ncbi:MAG: anhydro-N-acetylmuramic acid kinase [Leptolyngbyaceae cyanobacterium HOT.MB2.61]|nr:anhydro-N-acetylmuramic acid kinase [Leptolyngbyaceae cyanobacterium HOT.MB2.61]